MSTFLNGHKEAAQIFKGFKSRLEVVGQIELFGSVSAPPLWAALWPIYYDYQVEGDRVYMYYEGQVVFSVPRVNADVAIVFFYHNRDNKKYVIEMLDDFSMDLLVGESFESKLMHIKEGVVEKPQVDNGQLKLFINACEVVESSDRHVVVIGGGGPMFSVSGMAYSALADVTPNIQWEIYDPLSRPYKDKNITMHGQYFDYMTNRIRYEVTSVIDDAYYVVDKQCDWNDMPVIDETPSWYRGKFAVFKDTGVYRLIATPGSHTNHNYGHMVGGGDIDKKRDPPIVRGSSGEYGPYDSNLLSKYYRHWYVFPSGVFSNSYNYERLKHIFPNAKISIKALSQEMYSEAIVKEQFYYKGNEKRAYYRCNLVPDTGILCIICHYTHHCSYRLRVSQDKMREIFVKVGGLSCDPYRHRNKLYAQNVVKEMSRRWADKRIVIDKVCSILRCSEQTALALTNSLVRKKEIYVYKSFSGDRFARYELNPPYVYVPYDKIENYLKLLIYLFSVKTLGLYSMGEGERLLYIGDLFFPYMDVVVPVSMSSKVYTQYDGTHVYVESPFPVFVPSMIRCDLSLLSQLIVIFGKLPFGPWSFSDTGFRVYKSDFQYSGHVSPKLCQSITKYEKDILTRLPQIREDFSKALSNLPQIVRALD